MTKKTPKTPLTNKLKRGILRAGDALSLNKVFGSTKVALKGLRKDRICWNRRMVRPFRSCFFEIFSSKENIMKKTVWKIIASLALVVGIAALSACGGGGGGGSTTVITPPPVVTATATLVVSGCTIADGGSSCPGTSTYATTNATAPRALVNGISVSSLVSATLNPSFNIGTNSVSIVDGTNVLASATAAANCGATSAPVAGVCQPVVLHYVDKVYSIWTGGLIYATTKAGVALVTNNTSYQAAGALLNCSAPNKPIASGKLLYECSTVVGGITTRRDFSLDPTTNILTDYTSTVPADITFTSVDSSSVQPVAGTTSAHVADGWYYADPAASWHLLFQADAGGAPTVVKAGTFAVDGTVKVIRAYNN